MKKKVKNKSKSALKVLIPDHVKRTTDNSEWCGTVKIFKKDKKDKKETQSIIKNWL